MDSSLSWHQERWGHFVVLGVMFLWGFQGLLPWVDMYNYTLQTYKCIYIYYMYMHSTSINHTQTNSQTTAKSLEDWKGPDLILVSLAADDPKHHGSQRHDIIYYIHSCVASPIMLLTSVNPSKQISSDFNWSTDFETNIPQINKI